MYYRKLIDYLPDILKNIKEIKLVLNDCVQPEINDLWNNIDKTLNNQFISDIDIDGVKKWEKILNLKPKLNLSLDERKFTILTKLNSELPYTIPMLKNKLKSLVGEGNFETFLYNNEYKLKVLLNLKAENSFNDVIKMLDEIVPANMIIECLLKYYRYTLAKQYTYNQLSKNTYSAIRNGVLNNYE